MAVYTLAFVAYAVDVARRSAAAAVPEEARELVSAGAPGAPARPAASAPAASGSAARPGRGARIGFALIVIAWALHLGGAVLRGLAAGRVPWANMYEFALTGVAVIVGVFVLSRLWRDLNFLGVFISGLATVFLGLATVNFYVTPTPLPPALQSYWLVIHVFVATLATGFFALGSGLSILQLIKERRDSGFLRALPSTVQLEDLAYRVGVIGFIFWTFTLIAGAIWAEHAWGRYWGWDTKEVWTFVIWVVYAGYIHARATRGWRGSRSAWLQLVGFAAIIFNYSVVNLFFKGLHAYSGL
ncbi:c-type cytochrome biogenesis protein CcsB [Agrococcus sp. Marseille-Q4369]|uniref:c-type cytochrome biogenesis protein CcsB n=1 Tax=Agrococcus sp. Marseille-Q4369 TaxID=2810513 RepID=UPI001B8B9039|nr:c-type cytochrome biogenesis protein CcsB [Agrococcus sp. Marseille-Q4369]QUW20204.1 c-type cytochrome biogenesis protein CcsB [Agrococcus sp. Marseille-Q4369]